MIEKMKETYGFNGVITFEVQTAKAINRIIDHLNEQQLTASKLPNVAPDKVASSPVAFGSSGRVVKEGDKVYVCPRGGCDGQMILAGTVEPPTEREGEKCEEDPSVAVPWCKKHGQVFGRCKVQDTARSEATRERSDQGERQVLCTLEVRCYQTDEGFGYDRWRGEQFSCGRGTHDGTLIVYKKPAPSRRQDVGTEEPTGKKRSDH